VKQEDNIETTALISRKEIRDEDFKYNWHKRKVASTIVETTLSVATDRKTANYRFSFLPAR